MVISNTQEVTVPKIIFVLATNLSKIQCLSYILGWAGYVQHDHLAGPVLRRRIGLHASGRTLTPGHHDEAREIPRNPGDTTIDR